MGPDKKLREMKYKVLINVLVTFITRTRGYLEWPKSPIEQFKPRTDSDCINGGNLERRLSAGFPCQFG